MRAQPRKLSWNKVGWPLLLACTFFYIGFHAVSGDRGLVAWFKESRKLTTLKADLATATAEREEYERKVKLLSSNSLDLDMLDEQARSVLGFAAPDEIVVIPRHTEKE